MKRRAILCLLLPLLSVGCSSLKPVPVASDGPASSTTVGQSSDQVDEPGRVIPGDSSGSATTAPTGDTADAYQQALQSILLSSADFPSTWMEDSSGAGTLDESLLGTCTSSVRRPLAGLGGPSYSVITAGATVVMYSEAALYATPSDAASEISDQMQVGTGGPLNIETELDGARVESIDVEQREDSGLKVTNITVALNRGSGIGAERGALFFETISRGRATATLAVIAIGSAVSTHETTITEAEEAFIARFAVSSLGAGS